MDTKTLADLLISEAEDIKAEDVRLFEVSEYSSIADYIIICEGRSQAHVKGIADRIEKAMKERNIAVNIEGYAEGSWILIDCNDVILHIFHPETRKYYNLEEIHIDIISENSIAEA
jgi:ribosome-associated protein